VGSNAGQWLNNGTSIYYNLGYVGIGVSNPISQLDVRGSNTDDGAVINIGNSDLSHRLVLFGGRQNDPNPFINWKQGDPLRFTTDEGGWSEKMRITSDGRVGIGTDLPIEKLHVDGYLHLSNTIGGYPFIRFNNTFTGGNSGLEFKENGVNKAWIYYNGSNNSLFLNAENIGGNSPQLVKTSDGSVRIGTPTPEASFHVAKTTGYHTGTFGTNISPWTGGSNVAVGNDNEDAVFYVGQAPMHEGFLLWQYNSNPADAYYSIGTYNGSNNLTLQEYGGNVGVRTNAPAALLHVGEASPGYTGLFGSSIGSWASSTNVNIGDDNGPAIMYIGQSATNKGFLYWNYNATPANAYYHIGTYNGANPLVLQGDGATGGKVGIGTTAPSALFHVAEVASNYTGLFGTPISSYTSGTNLAIGDDNANALLYVGQNASNKGFLIWNYSSTPSSGYFSVGTYSGNNPLVLQSAGGNVGIGTTTPTSLLDVAFNLNAHNYLGYSNIHSSYFYHNEVVADGDGQTALYAFRTRDAQNDGTGYSYYTCNTAMKGYSYWGDVYSFGLGGFNYNDYTRCGGVLGAYAYASTSSYWGALGYKSSGSVTYGGYFTSSTTGTGKSSQANTGIGIGAWGDLMGADIHGKVYGVYAEGENYSMYSNGPVYKNDIDVHLQENGTGTNTVLFTNVSTDVTIQTSGYATLSNGKVSISFDPAFAATVSKESPVVITVTPMGNSNGVYLSEVSKNGFSVVENNDGQSSVTVSFIAIGKRAGYEHPNLSQEVIDAGYTINMARGLHNDADTKTNGEGLYYANGQLVVGVHPSLMPDPNKPTEDPYKPLPGPPESKGRIKNSSPTGIGDFTPAPHQVEAKPSIESPAGTGSSIASPQKVLVKEIPAVNSAGEGKITNEPKQQAKTVIEVSGNASERSKQPTSIPNRQE